MIRIKLLALSLVFGLLPLGAEVVGPTVNLHAPMVLLAANTDGSVNSPNWSGYAVKGPDNSITSVQGSWIVPEATCGGSDPKNSGASHWVGIDGYTSSTVEQTGTDADCSAGSPVYYAWYEFYPSPGTTITSIAVHAGDIMQASVTFDGTEFTATITDITSQQTFSTSQAVPGAKRNSAEWIAEANSKNFTNFGTAYFGQNQTGVTNTNSVAVSASIGKIANVQYHAIKMVDSRGTVMAVPGALSTDGSSFSVAWQSNS